MRLLRPRDVVYLALLSVASLLAEAWHLLRRGPEDGDR
jgi:hypothetical protein